MKRLLAIAAAVVFTISCSYGDEAAPLDEAWVAPPATKPTEKSGSLSFALTAPGGVELSSFSYVITGPNFARPGNIDVSNSTTVSALIEGIPAGSGYSITLQGTAGAPAPATCSGSATFAITAGEVAEVPVFISCQLQDEAPTPPTPPQAVPIPPLSPVLLGLILLASGSIALGRRRDRSI